VYFWMRPSRLESSTPLSFSKMKRNFSVIRLLLRKLRISALLQLLLLTSGSKTSTTDSVVNPQLIHGELLTTSVSTTRQEEKSSSWMLKSKHISSRLNIFLRIALMSWLIKISMVLRSLRLS
jgi:hypothetical protein